MINNEYENCLDEVENLDENNADFEQFTYVQKESELDDILEHMFETVIKPYIENYCQKEILHKLTEHSYESFKYFFYEYSPYYEYIIDNAINL